MDRGLIQRADFSLYCQPTKCGPYDSSGGLIKTIILSLALILFSCQEKEDNSDLTKTETIFSNSSQIAIDNEMGKMEIKVGDKNEFSYQKKRWEKWCLLHHKEENGQFKVLVENTSFTGNSGCELHWKITITKDAEVTLAQDAGTISGQGAIKSLSIDLAAGNISWTDSNSPIRIQVAAGNVEFKNAQFPKEGNSKVNVATGNITITSPANSSIQSKVNTATGPGSNDFSENKEGHNLEINVALGKASHKKI